MGLFKKTAALICAAIIFCSFGAISVFAERIVPVADPDFVDITLEEFLEQNPGYQGYPDKAKRSISAYTVSGSVEWRQIGGKYYLYYTGTNTKVVNDWYYENGKWYFLKPGTGEMAISWCQVGSYWYYFNGGGAMQVDWYQVSGKWYYFRKASIPNDGKPEGSMLVGAYYLPTSVGSTNATRNYYFDYYGAMQDWLYPVAPNASGNYPTSLSSCFNDPRGGPAVNHQGIDINKCDGQAVRCATAGEVISSGENVSMGNYVIQKSNVIGHTGNNLIMRYMHMQANPKLAPGFQLSRGKELGKVGNTGESNGPHLHFDINFKNKSSSIVVADCLNPAAFFPNMTLTQGPTAEVPPYGPNYNYAD